MIKKITLSLVVVSLGFFAYNVVYKAVFSNGAGAPASYTGSPGDGHDCTFCHNPSATTVSDWITSDIPTAGYTPGSTYTITATATDANTNKFGFEISPQLTSGNPMGQMQGMFIVTNTTETVLVSTTGSNDNKYITHRAAGTNGSNNTKTWTFNWLAPTVQPKSVTFYGAFVAGTSPSTDHTYLSSHTRGVNPGAVNDNNLADLLGLNIYPNPSSTETSVSLFNEKPATLNIQLFDFNGRLVKQLVSAEKFKGDFTRKFSLNEFNNGIYLLKFEIDGNSCFKKLIIG